MDKTDNYTQCYCIQVLCSATTKLVKLKSKIEFSCNNIGFSCTLRYSNLILWQMMKLNKEIVSQSRGQRQLAGDKSFEDKKILVKIIVDKFWAHCSATSKVVE